eukprot:TRINITY_DN14682_c0_g1_i1.p1 TRINITY_DN14682_c0_g1~~TRINITY_DN14682_c0_g1_i1.p1  ORF type:complete len:239 (-),score=20.46 TRINITY_DN14682_c0_g1_i1:408-1124(-)
MMADTSEQLDPLLEDLSQILDAKREKILKPEQLYQKYMGIKIEWLHQKTFAPLGEKLIDLNPETKSERFLKIELLRKINPHQSPIPNVQRWNRDYWILAFPDGAVIDKVAYTAAFFKKNSPLNICFRVEGEQHFEISRSDEPLMIFTDCKTAYDLITERDVVRRIRTLIQSYKEAGRRRRRQRSKKKAIQKAAMIDKYGEELTAIIIQNNAEADKLTFATTLPSSKRTVKLNETASQT